jgi:hypothetical protein
MANRFQMELRDGRGALVVKTAKGRELAEPLDKPFGLTTGINVAAGYSGVPPLHHGHSEMLGGSQFALQDYFTITNAGIYKLRFQLKVIWFPMDWKGSRKTTNVPVVTLPPVESQIEVNAPQSVSEK